MLDAGIISAMRALIAIVLIMLASIAPAQSVDATIKAWVKSQELGLGLLKNVSVAAKAESVFEAAPQPLWDVAPPGMEALGLPQGWVLVRV